MKYIIKLSALVLFLGLFTTDTRASDPVAQHDTGMQYYKGQKGGVPNLNKAIELWKKSAAAGYPPAQFDLGVLYKVGQVDGKPNLKEAARLWEMAAEAGYGPAMVNLGIAYAQGEGVVPDLNRALVLMQAAVEAYEDPDADYPDADIVLARLDDMIGKIKSAMRQAKAG